MIDFDGQQADPIDARVEDNKSKAFALRRRGWSYRRIARELGMGKSQVHRYVTESLAELRVENADQLQDIRELELARLDDMQAALIGEAKDDETVSTDPRTVDSILRIMERRAKLMGLDAPTKWEGSGPNGGPIRIAPGEIDITQLTADELADLERLLQRAQARTPTAVGEGSTTPA